MNVKHKTKLVFNRTLRTFGWELQKSTGHIENNKLAKNPDLIEDPLDALLLSHSGKRVAFNCPIELCRFETGFGYVQNKWHPFVATLQQYEKNKNLVYEDSVLKQYYELWQPANAAEALAGFPEAPKQFYQMPSYCMFLSPWTSRCPEEVKTNMTKYVNADYSEHGRPDLKWDQHGLNHFGPVTDKVGMLEFSRLKNIYNILKAEGYDRNHGEIGVFMIRKDGDYRFLIGGGGYHRAAAMAALGYKMFPAQYRVASFVANAWDVQHWPLVRSGLWTENEALAYVEHLFNFDSCSWAKRLGILK